jgi:hypothetical protein
VSHDLTFYRTVSPAPRLLARMRRAWLPASHAWLFPPRDAAHDVGGWLVEWEGPAARGKAGYLHPAVFVTAAALRSLDAEGVASGAQRWWRALVDRLWPGGGRGG